MTRIIYFIAFAFGFSSMNLAFSIEGTPLVGSTETPPLSLEELALEARLEKEISVEVEAVLSELSQKEEITAATILDFAGNVLAHYEGADTLDALPTEAELLFIDGTTHYYVLRDKSQLLKSISL